MSVWKSALLSLPHRWWQLAVATLSVLLGVAALSGSLMLGVLTHNTTSGVIAASSDDLGVLPKGYLVATDATLDTPPLDDGDIAAIQEIEGIEAAGGEIRGATLLPVTADGRVLDAALAPTLSGDGTRLEIVEGAAPIGVDEVALDAATLDHSGYSLGQSILLARPGPFDPIRARITGIVGSQVAPIPYVMFSRAGAREHFLPGGFGYNAAWIRLAPDADVPAVREALRVTVPTTYETVSRSEVASAVRLELYPRLTAAQIVSWSLIGVALLAAATLVGAGITNLVSARHNEVSGLRRLGASRLQIQLPILAEVLVVGLVGSLIGIPLGRALAEALNDTGWRGGLPLGTRVPEVPGPVFWLCLGLGVASAVYAAHRQSTTAEFLSPRPAIPNLEAPRFRFSDATWSGIGLALIGWGLFLAARHIGTMPRPGIWAAIGAAVLIGGALVASPVLAALPVTLFGQALRLPTRGISLLTARNVTRRPTGFARAVAALLVTTAALATTAVLNTSAQASAAHDVPTAIRGDLVVSSRVAGGFPTGMTAELAGIPGVTEVRSFGATTLFRDGEPLLVGMIEPGSLARMTPFSITEGRDIEEPDEVLIRAGSRAASGIKRGQALKLQVGEDRADLKVVGFFEAGLGLPDVLAARSALIERGVTDNDVLAVLDLSSPMSTADVQARATTLLAPNPLLHVETPAGYATRQTALPATVSNVLDDLRPGLWLISVIGLAGSLLLSQVGRERELRALHSGGMQRSWLLGMVASEAVLAGTIGALIGTATGALAGWGIAGGLAASGFGVVRLPWAGLAGLVWAGVLVGLLAAIPSVLLTWLGARPRTASRRRRDLV